MAKYRCTVCNWVYDDDKEGTPFADLPDSYTCPVCGAPKSAFVLEGEDEKSPVDEISAIDEKSDQSSIPKTSQSSESTVADKILEQIESFGVNHIYGIPGDSNLPIIESMRKRGKIKFVLTRHEETAAFMASAHGKMTDGLGVCISIAGPGSTNLITGLMDAQTDRSPVLALLGQVPEIYLGSEAFQEINQIELFSPISEYTETIARANQAIKTVLNAGKYAYKQPGVSALSTPTDVLTDKLDSEILDPSKRLFPKETVADDESVKRAAELINKTGKIAVLAGWGSRHSGELLNKLSDKLKAPIATTSRSKGVINETDNLAVGVLGSIGSEHAAHAIKDCDLLILLGTGFRQANLLPAGKKVVQIDLDPTRIGKTVDVDVGLVGDVKLTLDKLIPQLNEKQENREYIENISKQKEAYNKEIERESQDHSIPINPGYVIQAIKRNAKSDAIITLDVGDHTYWFYKKFICEKQRTYMSANMASMAFALPAALSAKLDYPEKQVIGISGDGGFAMLMADFTTAVRENLGITLIVFNDGKLKNIKKEQARDDYPEYGVSFPNPNFAEFAKGCGGEGYRVEDPNDLDEALKNAFASGKPTIVDIVVNPEKMSPATKRVN